MLDALSLTLWILAFSVTGPRGGFSPVTSSNAVRRNLCYKDRRLLALGHYGAIIRPATNLYVPASKNKSPRTCTVLPFVTLVRPQSSVPAC